MNPRETFDYKCSTCKRMCEPGEFGNNERTGARLKTCKPCRRKRFDREAAFRARVAAFDNVFIPAETGPRDEAEPDAEPEPEENPEVTPEPQRS